MLLFTIIPPPPHYLAEEIYNKKILVSLDLDWNKKKQFKKFLLNIQYILPVQVEASKKRNENLSIRQIQKSYFQYDFKNFKYGKQGIKIKFN